MQNNFYEEIPTRRGSISILDMRFNSEPLRDRHVILISARSNSSQKKVAKARTVLSTYSNAKQQPVPESVTSTSSVFILNVLADHCKVGTLQSQRNDSMRTLIYVLQHAIASQDI